MTNQTNIKSALNLATITLVAALLSAPVEAGAHEINRSHGFYFGGVVMGTGIDATGTQDDFAVREGGGGVGLRIGWLFNPKFSLELLLAAQVHDTSENNIVAGLGSFDLLAYYHFRGDQHLRPYVKGGFGGYGLGFDEKKETGATQPRVEGTGLAFGGGIEYFLGNHFSLGADWTHHIINYERKVVDLGSGLTQANELNEKGAATTFGVFLTIYI